LVEQSIRNRQVIGSSPIVGSISFVAALQTAWDLRFPEICFCTCRTPLVGLAAIQAILLRRIN
jgi:hypothetical protein